MAKDTLRSFEAWSILGYISILVIIISIFFIGISFTGRVVTTTGQVNVTIESTASVSLIDNFINLGSGQVTAGITNATVNSWGDATANGNWSAVSDYMMIENVGNVNATVTVASGKTAATYIGGTSVTPTYKLNVTRTIESGSCMNGTAIPSGVFGNLITLDTTALQICAPLIYDDANDTINLSIQLVIPADAVPGTKTDTLTIAGTAA